MDIHRLKFILPFIIFVLCSGCSSRLAGEGTPPQTQEEYHGAQFTPPVRIDKDIQAPFGLPARGFVGFKHLDPIDNNILHLGIDFWANRQQGKTWVDTTRERGNPVFAVADGQLSRTDKGVIICHPELDSLQWAGLPAISVCTVYENLKDFPARIASLKKNPCPQKTDHVMQGELLGFMDYDSDVDVVFLNFIVVRQKNGCLDGTINTENTYDPFPYLGFDGEILGWLVEFP